MPRHSGPVLLDNCAISAAVHAGVWKALLGGYRLETVEEVAGEAGNLFRRRNDACELSESFRRVQVHSVSDSERVQLTVATDALALDSGERDLWAHAIGRTDQWILCGPDVASLRAAVRLGLSDSLVSLERLLTEAGGSAKGLRHEQTEKWLRMTVQRLKDEETVK